MRQITKIRMLSILMCLALLSSGCGKNKDVETETKSEQQKTESDQQKTESEQQITEENQAEQVAEDVTEEPTVTLVPIHLDEKAIAEAEESDKPIPFTGYADEFMQYIGYMKQYYIFTDFKKIDLDALADKYVPLFRHADETKDETEVFDTWTKFCNEIPDGHVYVTIKSDDMDEIRKGTEENKRRTSGIDYGFCLITKDNGDTVFVNVDAKGDAYQVG